MSEEKRPPESTEELLERYAAGERNFGADRFVGKFVRVELDKANLSGVDLSGINLKSAALREVNLYKANLRKADLSAAYMLGANLDEADLSEANLSGVELTETSFRSTLFKETNLSGANLSGADLSSVNLVGLNLSKADFTRTNLSGANLERASLNGAYLAQTSLEGANLRGANLRGASLEGASLAGANFEGANLSEVDLSEVDLREAASFQNSIVNASTYQKSGWTPEILSAWHSAGAFIKDPEELPQKVYDVIFGYKEGLTLYFNTRLNRIDRFTIEGVIVTILGRDTDCEIAEFKQHEDRALIRLEAKEMDDLERVADALHTIAWSRQEQTQQAHTEAIVKAQSKEVALQLSEVLGKQIRQTLYELVDHKLEKMELRGEDREVVRDWQMPAVTVNVGDINVISNSGQMAGVSLRDGQVNLNAGIDQAKGEGRGEIDGRG